jgi:hypothetical protein
MGKVLEMMLHPILRLAAVMTACASLGGCGSPLVKVALARAAGPSAPAAIKPAKDSPQIAMTLVSRGIKFPMQQLDVDGNVRLWAAADGAQVALRDGILISTRGFGMDLMSADVPSVAGLLADHSRTHHYLDGTDTPIRRSYTCTAATEPGGGDGGVQVQTWCQDQSFVLGRQWHRDDLQAPGTGRLCLAKG